MTARDYVALANQYARDVVHGKVLACRYVKLACQRHLDGLKNQRRKAYPFKLDEAAATKVCRFVELMPHVKGKWARDHERMKLEPWQCFIVVNVWGWKSKATGLRRYRRAYTEVPRKSGKSSLTAALANYMLVADGEHGAEIYSGAGTEKQAWEVFGPARLMARNCPDLIEAYGVNVGAKNLHVIGTASKCEPIIGKPGDGASPSFSITDEYHEHATSEQYDTMVTGMGAREQPIAWVITTAGSDTAGPCYALRSEVIDVLEGKVERDELFGLIYTIDEEKRDRDGKVITPGVDWTSETALRMANPNMGVSVFEDFLRTEQKRAISNPREQATFKTKHLNVWVTAASPFFNAETWSKLGDAPALESWAGSPCVVGVDLAAEIDLTAQVKVFWKDGENGKTHFYVYGRFYCAEEQTKKPTLRHYADWAERGYLVATPGSATDHDYIESDIKADGDTYPIAELAIDQYSAQQLITHFQNHFGEERVLKLPQTVQYLSQPMKLVRGLIDEGRIHHDGNPVLAWCIGNVTAQEDRNENVFPRKERPEKKIDGVTALLNAMNRLPYILENGISAVTVTVIGGASEGEQPIDPVWQEDDAWNW